MPGRTDNSVKNYFYSLLRKGVGKVNAFLCQHRARLMLRGVRDFDNDFISKLMSILDDNTAKFTLAAKDLIETARKVLAFLFDIYREEGSGSEEQLEEALSLMRDLRRKCRRKRAKEDISDDEGDHLMNEESHNSVKNANRVKPKVTKMEEEVEQNHDNGQSQDFLRKVSDLFSGLNDRVEEELNSSCTVPSPKSLVQSNNTEVLSSG